MSTRDTSWTRALMASSGFALGHEEAPRHASAEWHEAADADTPLVRIQKLATSKEIEVRTIVARRPDCPMGVLAALAFDHSSDVRAAVAGNARITEAVCDHLAKDRDAKVVKALARNHAIDLALLQRLALHRKDEVRRVASRNLDERIHGSDASTVTSGGKALGGTADGAETPRMPFELRDRVQESPAWQPVVEAPPSRRQATQLPPVPRPTPMPTRLHPN